MGEPYIEDADVIVVGAGFYGATIAELVATKLGLRVLVIDRRSHIGGNAYSETDPGTGIEIHRYGAHLFHTSNEEIWSYLKTFSDFTDYRHRVFSQYQDHIYSMPINLGTICQFFGRAMGPKEAHELLRSQTTPSSTHVPENLEEKAISLIGKPLYDAFIRGYTQKQWQTDPKLLPPDIITRLPVRFTFDNRYFSDTYEGLPVNGYTAIFERMLANPLIRVALDTDYFAIRHLIRPSQYTVYSGPIDRFFDFGEGRLAWRTLDFHWTTVDVDDFQGTAVINYADPEIPYTRSIEFRHFHPERRYSSGKTILSREFSRSATADDEPFYPVNTPEDRRILQRYRERTRDLHRIHFGGRLGSYKYLDMHQAIGSAMKAYRTILEPDLRLICAGASPS